MGVAWAEVAVVVAVGALPVLLSPLVASRKGYTRVWLWVILGLLLSWAVFVILAFLPSRPLSAEPNRR